MIKGFQPNHNLTIVTIQSCMHIADQSLAYTQVFCHLQKKHCGEGAWVGG